MKQKECVRAAKFAILHIALADSRFTGGGEGGGEGGGDGGALLNMKTLNASVFLAAYLVVAYPDKVLDSKSPKLEGKLKLSAAIIIEKFDSIVALIVHLISTKNSVSWIDDGIATIASGFTASLHQYMHDFRAWKTHDESILLVKVKASLTALVESERRVKPIPSNDATLLEFKTRIGQMRAKIAQFGGPNALKFHDEHQATRDNARARAVFALSLANNGGVSYFTSLTLPRQNPTDACVIAYQCMHNAAFRLDDNNFNQSFYSIEQQVINDEHCVAAALSFLPPYELTHEFKVHFLNVENLLKTFLNIESFSLIPRPILHIELFEAELQPGSLTSGFYPTLFRDLVNAMRPSVRPHRIQAFDESAMQLCLNFDAPPIDQDLDQDQQQLATFYLKNIYDFVSETMNKVGIDKMNDRYSFI